MAPMARNSLVPGRSQFGREPGWQFSGLSDMGTEREVSIEPNSSVEDDMMGDDDRELERQNQLDSPEDNEDVLHPLREAANRVGREVERFAEALDGYNPLRAMARDEKYEMTLDLIDLYYQIALDTLTRLREQHEAERRKRDGLRWRKKMRGFKITQDDEDMEVEGADGDYNFPQQQTTLEDLERWEQEAQTWDLLRRLVQHRYPSPDSETQGPKRRRKLNKFSTEREVWEDFLDTDDLALERKTVLQWLKDTAEESGEDIDVLVHDLQQNAERGDIIGHGWIHTKAAIKHRKRLHTWSQALDPASPDVSRVNFNSSGTEPLITQLDPDAATRQDRSLEAQDEYFERAIWLGCYEMLRRGKNASEIKEWCMDRTETWRAVSMSALPDEKLQDGNEETANPASDVLWRRMCFALARKGGGDEYERAVYGILSGDISSVEPICRSWDDFVFVHYNALLRTQFDNHLQNVYPRSAVASTVSNFGSFDAIQFHGDSTTTGRRLVETLKSDPRTARETSQPMKMLQGVLIANQFDHFIHQQGLALAKLANADGPSNLIPAMDVQPENENINKYVALDDHDSLRVLTHVLLIFMSLDPPTGAVRKGVIENVIVSYISFLRLAGKEELIPLYCSQLTGARRYATLSRNLIDVTDNEQRVTQIRLMRELGLDVQEFVRFQSRYLFTDYPDPLNDSDEYYAAGKFKLLEASGDDSGRKVRKDFFGDDPERVERIDMLLIRSLEWYLLVDGLWSETFYVGTLLYLRFFKHMHLTAARALSLRINSSDVAKSKTRALIGQSMGFEGLEDMTEDEDLTEVIDGSANDKRLLKKFLLAEARSFRELETLTLALDNMETITSLGQLMDEEPDPRAKRGWRQRVAGGAQAIRPLFQPMLKGWLLTSQRDDILDQFKNLREAYLPETILAYISTLQYCGEVLSRDLLMECMDLSSILAGESSDLLDLFTKVGRVQELVEAFADAGKSLLLITAAKGSSKSKKLRLKGWSPELWTVKS